MGAARGQANQSLYLGRILLAAWQRDLDAEDVPAATLSQAYLPAVREHLVRAYGWFLLEIARPEPLPDAPPRHSGELPTLAEGKALPGEIREFGQMEQGGWLGAMLAEMDDPAPRPGTGSPGNLAAGRPVARPEQALAWAEGLQALFDRMGDSLDEY